MDRTVRIDLAYDGADFSGWQVQPDRRTVQGELTAMISRLLDRPLKPTGAGRTDTGVHALGQVAHAPGLSGNEVDRLERALAKLTPDDMEIIGVREVSPAFDARFSAVWRRYEYRLHYGRDIFRRRGEMQIDGPLDREAVEEATASLTGRRDFTSFCKTASLKEDNTCDVTEACWTWHDHGAEFTVQADHFLHHMVRTMVGTLVEIGKGRSAPTSLAEILAARDRCAAGTMAPAQGLYLSEVGYPEALLDPGFRPATRPEETP